MTGDRPPAPAPLSRFNPGTTARPAPPARRGTARLQDRPSPRSRAARQRRPRPAGSGSNRRTVRFGSRTAGNRSPERAHAFSRSIRTDPVRVRSEVATRETPVGPERYSSKSRSRGYAEAFHRSLAWTRPPARVPSPADGSSSARCGSRPGPAGRPGRPRPLGSGVGGRYRWGPSVPLFVSVSKTVRQTQRGLEVRVAAGSVGSAVKATAGACARGRCPESGSD